MLKRLYFPLVALFWVIMNVLLWRSEMSGRGHLGSSIPIQNVWERILTAPDDSSLQILHHGRKIGYCRWVPNITTDIDRAAADRPELEIEGQVRRSLGYTIDLDGNFVVDDSPQRLRFAWHAEFSTNHVWRKLHLRVHYKPQAIDIRADAATEQLSFKVEGAGTPWEQTLTFAELAKPENLFARLGVPLGWNWLGLGGAAAAPASLHPAQLALGVSWEARNDWLKLGHSQLRVYRLQARILDKYQVVVLLSRVGELLRVELPNDIVLLNEAMTNL